MTVLVENPVDLEMPPMNIIRCQCLQNICPMSGPCPLEATGDDLMCDECREYEKHARQMANGVYSPGLIDTINFLRKAGAVLSHCHKCDPEFYSKGDDNGDSDGQA